MSGEYQTRWLAYCATTGPDLTPEQVWKRDGDRYPGGKGCGYILWIQARIREWRALVGHTGPLSNADHDAFNRWLWAKVQPQIELEVA